MVFTYFNKSYLHYYILITTGTIMNFMTNILQRCIFNHSEAYYTDLISEEEYNYLLQNFKEKLVIFSDNNDTLDIVKNEFNNDPNKFLIVTGYNIYNDNSIYRFYTKTI